MSELLVRLLKITEVGARVGFGRNAIYERLNADHKRFDPEFPKPVHLPGSTQIRFASNEVDAWIAAQIARRDENLSSMGQPGQAFVTRRRRGPATPPRPSPTHSDAGSK